jgi:L-ribulose-5-phosphate 3-epimerase
MTPAQVAVMLKSLSIWALKDNESRPADSLFAEVRQHGFDAVEPAVGLKGLLTPASTEADCRRLLDAASRKGLAVSSLASGLGWTYPLTAEDPAVSRKGVEVLRASLQIAAWLGVEVLLVVPGQLAPLSGESADHVPYDVALARMREGLARALPAAQDLGVTMGIENVWNRVLLSPLEMRAFIDGFETERVASYLDVGNMILFGYAEDWISILGGRIRCVHFKDFKRSVGTLAGFCDLLEGDVNFPAVMQGLRAAGYDGPCVAEFFGLDSAGLKKLSAAMDRILAM